MRLTTVTYGGSANSLYSPVCDHDNAGRIKAWNVDCGANSASAAVEYDNTGMVKSEVFGNKVKRDYAYDCHGWITDIVTSIPKLVKIGNPVSLPLSAGNSFYNETLGIDIGGISGLIADDENVKYTERVIYDGGVHPRYDGTASAHVSTTEGRYDFTFDCHDRLIKADYSKSKSVLALTEDFSTEYTYNSIGAPLSVRRFGINAVSTDEQGKTVSETTGGLDNLSYSWDGMLLTSIDATANGEAFYGRTGYPLSDTGGTGTYRWTSGGQLFTDSARGIKRIVYDVTGQIEKIYFDDGSELRYVYKANGELSQVDTYALLPGGKRPIRVSRRTYCGGFVFENDSLTMVNFDGGYFDGKGHPHYRHADFQGNIVMVTDPNGKIVHHTDYYPYGEPWREPDGQPYLYGSKERMRDNGLNYYDFRARRLNAVICLWSTPDPLALDYAALSPYSSCAANPVKYTDPDGCATFFMNKDDQLVKVGTDGKDDGRLFIVSSSLGKKIDKLTQKKEFYSGEVKNSRNMAEITDITDFEQIESAIKEANEDGYERGMNKDESGNIHLWDIGSEVESRSETELAHSLKPFKQNGKNIANPYQSLWYMHVHPKNDRSPKFGSSEPSDADKKIDNDMRTLGNYNGTTFIVGGKNGKVTFYYGEKIVATISWGPLTYTIKTYKK